MSRKPTEQQQAVVDAVVTLLAAGKPGMLKVEACAGSGKTSTLVCTAESAQAESIYLAFNKVTATEAAGKFPKWVECRTTHSLAYAAYGKMLYKKLSRPSGKYVNVAGTGSEIARFYDIKPIVVNVDVECSASYVGLLVKKMVANFEQSADTALKLQHAPWGELMEKCHGVKSQANYIAERLLPLAILLWEDRTNKDSVVLASHDTYLKLYQLSKPKLTGKAIIYVDEFQDTTPCVLDIVMNQTHAIVVMVGDARQAIYGWRGAVNAMQMVDAPALYLTKSFRYGQAIADVATKVLEGDMQITGNETINSVVGRFDTVDTTKPHTRLFRTNSALLMSALEVIEQKVPTALEIDTNDLVKLLESALALKDGDMKNVKHDEILPYTDWSELAEEAKHSPELGRIVKLVTQDDGFSAARAVVTLRTFKNHPTPLVTFTTAHKSKGREFDQVIVEEDFKSNIDENGDWAGISTEEQNLLYVAVTRAVHVLQYNETTKEYLRRHSQGPALIGDPDIVRKLKREMREAMSEEDYQYAA